MTVNDETALLKEEIRKLAGELWRHERWMMDLAPAHMCRDCGDGDGKCHLDNRPCDPVERAKLHIEAYVAALETIAAQSSGMAGSAARADCMAAYAAAILAGA